MTEIKSKPTFFLLYLFLPAVFISQTHFIYWIASFSDINAESSFLLFTPQRVRRLALDDVVVLNVDTNTLETPYDDLQSLPSDVVRLRRAHWHVHPHDKHQSITAVTLS